MQKDKLAHAIEGAILGLTKLAAVLQETNDALIHENNASGAVADAMSTPSKTESPATPASTDAPEPSGELDDENVPWHIDFHAATKGKVASKVVKGGQAWRARKGVDKDALEAYKAQFINKDSAPANNPPPAAGTPGTPGAPSTPSTPSTPGLPGTPAATEQSEATKLMHETIAQIKVLIDAFGLEWEDCKEIMTEQFGVAQNGNEVTFGGLTNEQYPQALEYFTDLLEEYRCTEALIENIKRIATPANEATVIEGCKALFANYHTESLDGVHYSHIPECRKAFAAWEQEWQAWANS